ncbi:MAG: hypothetical protein GY751_13555 [Bacteroidetes bacterium]|nr:hypothetical protein [Bacteroidota bacterium]
MEDQEEVTPNGKEDQQEGSCHPVRDGLEEINRTEQAMPTSLNDELVRKIKDNPNKFIGCGG